MWESLHVEIHSRKTLLQPNIDMSAVAESHAPILAAIDAGDTELACRLSREHQAIFRRVIMQAADNELLLRIWESLRVEIHSRKTLLQPNIDMFAVAESHAPILAAITAGDTELACRLSREHQQYFEHRA